MTQEQAIISHLSTGQPITALESLRLYGVMRLASRICAIKKRGVPVKTRRVETETGKFIAEYYL